MTKKVVVKVNETEIGEFYVHDGSVTDWNIITGLLQVIYGLADGCNLGEASRKQLSVMFNNKINVCPAYVERTYNL